MKFARRVVRFAGKEPPVCDVLMRSLSIGCIRSSVWPGPTEMPNPARTDVLPWPGLHDMLTRGRKLFFGVL